METIPTEYLSQPIQDWAPNLTTAMVIIFVLGRGYKAIRNGGGLRGLWRGLIFGENVPSPIAQDYKAELDNQNHPRKAK